MAILSSQQREEMKHFFISGCEFQWDGEGEPSVGSEIVYMIAKEQGDTHAKVCARCTSRDCLVRLDERHSETVEASEGNSTVAQTRQPLLQKLRALLIRQ